MRALLLASLLLLPLANSPAAVVRPAANFGFPGAGNKTQTLAGLRGQAVVLLISRSPRQRAFRRQLRHLEEIYQQFASKQVVFIAALREGAGPISSNIPFAVANSGSEVAAAYGADEAFQIVIIGRDGNVDYQTSKVLTGNRVRDVIQNAFPVQNQARQPAT
jgi:hypothetical protein